MVQGEELVLYMDMWEGLVVPGGGGGGGGGDVFAYGGGARSRFPPPPPYGLCYETLSAISLQV